MADKTDLHGVENRLSEIASELHKPLEDIKNDRRHEDILKIQNKHHKEILDIQKKFNEKNLLKQEGLVKWTKILAIATIILCLGTCLGTIYMTYNTKSSIDLQTNLYSPKITVQVTDVKLPWSHYAEEYEHKVWEKFWNSSHYSIPLYIEINNNGIVPFQLYNIQFESECGMGNRGLLSFPDNFTKVVGVGDTVTFTESIYFTFNTTVQDSLPCEIYFTIYGNNLVTNKKIVLI